MIRTFVAEPTTLTREGLVALLSREKDIELIAAVQHGEEVIPTALALRPEVAVLAAAFPDHDGFAIARAMHAALPDCRCAILSMCRQPGHLQQASAAHVHGYLVHDCTAEFFAEAVRQLARGNKVVDPDLTFNAPDTRACPLTLREMEVLRGAAKGITTAARVDRA